MAVTPQGAALTTAHQAAQARNAAVIAALLLRLWQALVKPPRLTEMSLQWLSLAAPLVVRQYSVAEGLAATYYEAFRAVEAPGTPPFTLPDLPGLPLEQVRTSLSVTGMVQLEKKIEALEKAADLTPAQVESEVAAAAREQAANVAAAGARLTILGGVDKVLAAQQADKTAFGYLRVTHEGCCFFCAMLAGRGPVFKDDSFDMSNPLFNGDGPAKIHDSCQCTLEPVFDRKTEWPGKAGEFQALWRSSTTGKAGASAILAFRRAYEGRSDPAEK